MGARQKLSSEEMEKKLKFMKKSEATAFLKGHHLLKACSINRPEMLPKVGEIVWARALGSVYWPGFIPELKDVPDMEPQDDIDDSTYTFVMFLEENFRYAPVSWENIIPAKDIDVQQVLINKYNKVVLKTNKGPATFSGKAIELLEEFLPLHPLERQVKAESVFKKIVTVRKRVSDLNKTPVKKEPISTDDDSAGEEPNLKKKYKEKINQMVSETKRRKKSGLRVSERIVTNKVVQLKSQSKAVTATKKTSTPAEKKASVKSKPSNKNARPEVGGQVMREWTKARFDKISKNYSFESSSPPPCNQCNKLIEEDIVKYCHGLPHHYDCMKEADTNPLSPGRKCSMCIEKLCFICRGPSEDKKTAHKCSRCDLRFHIDCLLKDWPQAEIQGSNGPITCPAHFCHTCLGEQKTNGKFRDFTTNPSKAYHCLLCLSTYHKSCLPAGCGEDIKGKDFIVCPRHKLPDLKVTQRRIGCLTCYKTMKGKEVERVECQFCIQAFHPECVGYTGDVKEKISLEDFARGYKCFSCRWGLFPLYGQVVWFQQPQSQYWPARILYPAEAKNRLRFAKRQPGQYSVEYFGTNSFYDNANRGVPLHLTTVEIFQRLKVYHDTPKILKAHEEASFFLQFFESHRDKILPSPKPYYKKIERNVYRTMGVTKTKEPTDVCSCYEDEKAEFVCVPDSGCTNRDMEMECSDKICKGGKRCSNRMFVERKNDHDFLEQKLFRNKGWGVVAKKVFEPGDFVAEYRGEVIDKNEMVWRLSNKEEEDPMYILEISKEFFIDAEYIGNMSRLINHSCDPNCVVRKYLSLGRSVGGIFAKRRIEIDEEVTFKYGCGSQSTAPFRCRCQSRNCLHFVGKDVPDGFQVDEELDQNDGKWEDVCSKCTFGGRLICCEFPGCGRVWHSQCAGLSRQPRVFFCPDHPSNSKAMQQIQKKLSTGNGRGGKRKRSNGSLSGTKSRRSSSTNSVSSEKIPKKRTYSKRLSAETTPSGRKLTHKTAPVNTEDSVQKTRKRKSKSENTGDHMPEPVSKKQKTMIVSESDNTSEDAPLINDTNPIKLASERKLRSSTSSKTIVVKVEPTGTSNDKTVVETTSDETNMLESKMLPPTNSNRRKAPKAPALGDQWKAYTSASVVGGYTFSSALRLTRYRRALSCGPSNDDDRDSVVSLPILPRESSLIGDSVPSAQLPNGATIGNRRNKLRPQSKSSEPFSPLALNSLIQGCVQENADDEELTDDKHALLRMGVVTRRNTESLLESQEFAQNSPQTVIPNGSISNHMEEFSELDELPNSYDEHGISDGKFQVEMNSPRRKRQCVHTYEASELSPTNPPDKLHYDFSEAENTTRPLDCLLENRSSIL